VEARKPKLDIRDQSSVQDNFQTAIDALHYLNVLEHRRVETTSKEEH
jgi:hypothetical protein